MPRIRFVLLMLIPLSASGSAQSPLSFTMAAPGSVVPPPEQVVARVMSFDRNGDGRVVEAELNERMKGLLARGDADRDGALDRGEVALLARRPIRNAGGERPLGIPTYQVPLDTWFPDPSHVEGALADLKLPEESYRTALAVVDDHRPHVDGAERRTAGALLRQMESLLTIEQLATLQTALQSQDRTQVVTFHNVVMQAGRTGDAGATVVRNAVLQFVDGQPVNSPVAGTNNPPVNAVRRMLRLARGDLGQVVEQFGLPPDRNREAHAAVERYRASLRVQGEHERACLVDLMKDVMSGEEREDFAAALARRSAVPMFGLGAPARTTRGVISVAPPVAAPVR